MKKSRKLSHSLFVVKDIKLGETFTEENIRSIRSRYGLLPKYLKDISGKKIKIDIKKLLNLCNVFNYSDKKSEIAKMYKKLCLSGFG